ncbi:TPA: hypothetical protein TY403_000459 [Streptococcus suis]|nr:hypothetical protein [Streptococcus suis]HEM2581720.1 hypothetical protein [Streptococcus suis]
MSWILHQGSLNAVDWWGTFRRWIGGIEMIDCSYLPYDSVRFYQDRGMAKWMGFFISEHSTALQES